MSPLTIQDARNILDLRICLEPQAAAQAAGAVRRNDFTRAEEDFARGYTPSDPHSFAVQLAANKELRLIIAKASGNARLVAIVSDLIDELERYLRLTFSTQPNKSEQSHASVKDLIDALVRGSPDEAMALTRDQLLATKESVLNALMSHDQVLAEPFSS